LHEDLTQLFSYLFLTILIGLIFLPGFPFLHKKRRKNTLIHTHTHTITPYLSLFLSSSITHTQTHSFPYTLFHRYTLSLTHSLHTYIGSHLLHHYLFKLVFFSLWRLRDTSQMFPTFLQIEDDEEKVGK